MEIKEFTERVRKKVSKELGAGYQVQMKKVYKNNHICLHGLTILAERQNVSPTIYLNHFLEAYNSGMTLSEVVSKIIRIYREGTPCKNVNMDFFKSFEKVADRICYRLISAQANRMLLEQIPHVLFLDLAICFYYAYEGKELGTGTILIHNSHMEIWGTTTEELMRLAGENTRRLFPWECRSMLSLIEGCEDKPGRKGMGDPAEAEDFAEAEGFAEGFSMLVLSNKQHINGAACILYPQVLEEIAQRTKTSFFILPSSIHETILIGDGGCNEGESLQKMVEEVNATQVEPEEVLSDRLYYYNSAEKSVKIIF